MSQGGYSHTTRATGTVLTAAVYNADHQNHVTNQNPVMTGGYSDNLSQMQLMTDPGTVGSESLPATLAGEIERLRYQIRLITGEPHWYVPPGANLKQVGGSVADNSIALPKLVNTTQGKLIGRVSNGAGPWQEFDIPSLTALVPGPSDFVLGTPAAGGVFRKIAVQDIATAVGIPLPQGRITLAPNTPVMSVTVPSSGTIYYAPYTGHQVPLWNGTAVIVGNTGGQLQQALNDTTKSPAAAIANKNYDIFFWMDGSTARISRGPPWASDTARGAGANTTELTRIQGLLVNAVAIVNGPAANRGTYLGTIRTNASIGCEFTYGTNGAASTPAVFGVWNQYNKMDIASFNGSSQTSWSYSGTWRGVLGGSSCATSWVSGQQEDIFRGEYNVGIYSGDNATAYGAVSFGLDGTATPSLLATGAFSHNGANCGGDMIGFGSAKIRTLSIGWHTITPLERTYVGSVNFYGLWQGDTRAGVFWEGRL